MQKWGSLNRVIFLTNLYFIYDDDNDDPIKKKEKIIIYLFTVQIPSVVIHDIHNILLIISKILGDNINERNSPNYPNLCKPMQ